MSTPRFFGNFLLAFVATGLLMEASVSGKFGSFMQEGARRVQRGFDGTA